jgi:hypothetical protein
LLIKNNNGVADQINTFADQNNNSADRFTNSLYNSLNCTEVLSGEINLWKLI